MKPEALVTASAAFTQRPGKGFWRWGRKILKVCLWQGKARRRDPEVEMRASKPHDTHFLFSGEPKAGCAGAGRIWELGEAAEVCIRP